MKKIILFSLLIMITLCTCTGCLFKINSQKYTCKGYSDDFGTYTNQIDYTAEVKNDALITLYVDSNNKYLEEKEYQDSCADSKRKAKETNTSVSSVYSEVVCNDEEKTVTVKKKYNVSRAMKDNSTKTSLSHTFKYVQKNGKFDLDGWKQSMSQNRMKCEW